MQDSPPGFAALEIQGLYGPFTFSEKLLQQIWARGDFSPHELKTTDGQSVRIVQPGRWNTLGGPDFRNARLKLGDEPEIEGDVELHLRAGDWAAHRHAQDPAYDRVRLHVVLFPPPPDHVTRGAAGRKIPLLVLLPLLNHDLEEYAAEAAIERLAGRPLLKPVETWRELSPTALIMELRIQAGQRWRQKVSFARRRLDRLGWTAACHHAALEILGYRFNRAPMLRLASQHPLTDWTDERVTPELAWESEVGRWSLPGVRPANHPLRRLRQYAAWAKQAPDWPQRLEAMATRLPAVALDAPTKTMRRVHRLGELRRFFAEQISAGQMGGTRLDNLVCDGWLPLLAARTGVDCEALWWHWFPGDLPPFVNRALRELGVFAGPANPAGHGPAQGLLGRILAQEIHLS